MDSSFRRKVIGTLDGVIRRAYEPDRDRGTLLADLQDAITRVSQGMSPGRLVSPGEAVDAYLWELTEMAIGRSTEIHYGTKAVDELIQPAQGRQHARSVGVQRERSNPAWERRE